MIFDIKKAPANPVLKQFFSKKGSFVIDSQVETLYAGIRDAICFQGNFLALLKLSKEPKTVNGKTALEPDTQLSFFTLTTSDGKRFYPVFTDEEELLKWRDVNAEGARRVVLNFGDFQPVLKVAADLNGIVINPMSDNFIMEGAMIGEWTERTKKITEFINQQLAQRNDAAKKAAAEKSDKDREAGSGVHAE